MPLLRSGLYGPRYGFASRVVEATVQLGEKVVGGFGDNRSGRKNDGCSGLIKLFEILRRNHTADNDQDIVASLFFKRLFQFRD